MTIIDLPFFKPIPHDVIWDQYSMVGLIFRSNNLKGWSHYSSGMGTLNISITCKMFLILRGLRLHSTRSQTSGLASYSSAFILISVGTVIIHNKIISILLVFCPRNWWHNKESQEENRQTSNISWLKHFCCNYVKKNSVHWTSWIHLESERLCQKFPKRKTFELRFFSI